MVTHRQCISRADLIFPLTWHHFCVRALDHQTCLDARPRVLLDDLATHHAARANAAVVRTLRTGLSTLGGEAIGATVRAHHRVFLLDAEDHLVCGELLGRLCALGARVGRVWLTSLGEANLTEHEDVLATAQRVRAREHRQQHAVGAVARRLFCRGPVEAPDRWRLDGVVQDLGLGAQHRGRLMSVHPDVFGLIWHGVPSG